MLTPHELSAVRGKIDSEQRGLFVPYEESCWSVGGEFAGRKQMCRNYHLLTSRGKGLHSLSPE